MHATLTIIFLLKKLFCNICESCIFIWTISNNKSIIQENCFFFSYVSHLCPMEQAKNVDSLEMGLITPIKVYEKEQTEYINQVLIKLLITIFFLLVEFLE